MGHNPGGSVAHIPCFSAGSGQDFGHGSAGAVILTLIIAIVALAQGRLLRLGRRDD